METRIESLTKMLSENPNDDFLTYALALEIAKDNLSEAIHLLENLIQKNENYLPTYYQLGKFYEQTKNTQQAIVCFQEGKKIAQAQKNKKTFSELNEALQQLLDE